MYMLRTKDGVVCWEYVKKLVEVQDRGELHMANKLTKRHVNYKEQIMKVKLAAQVFSQSTADALSTLSSCAVYPEFEGVDPTVKFLKVRQKNLLIDMNEPCRKLWLMRLSCLITRLTPVDHLAVHNSILLTTIVGSIHFTAKHHSNTIVLGASDDNPAAYRTPLS